MQAQAPEAIGFGVALIGFLTVPLVVPLYCVYHADANLIDKVVGGVEWFAMQLDRFRR